MENVSQDKPISIYIPYTFLVAALLSVFVVSLNKVELQPYETEYPAEAFISPDFELPTLAGGKVKLSQYRGKVVFINFWATWCGTCEVEMPSMEKLYRKFKDHGFEMLTISVDKDQTLIEPFMKKFNLTFPVLLDPESIVAKRVYLKIGNNILRKKNIENYNQSGKIYVSNLGKFFQTILSIFDFFILLIIS